MPTWCDNKLEIYSNNKKQLKEFIKKGIDPENESDLSLKELYPCPGELLQISTTCEGIDPKKEVKLKKKYGVSNAYYWRVCCWGTKWDIEAHMTDVTGNSICYVFESAWGPPIKWLIYVAKLFPDLEFKLKYISIEAGFRGVFEAHGESIECKYNELILD